MNLLIVDDDTDIRESLAGLFSAEGFVVSTAVNGLDALSQLRSRVLPCAVILDLLMPVLDGAQTYRQMQNDTALKDLPVFIFSSDDHSPPTGATTFKKPADIDRLVRAVRRACGIGHAANGTP